MTDPNAVEKARQELHRSLYEWERGEGDVDFDRWLAILEAAIRADEREQCAKQLSDEEIEEIVRDYASIGDGPSQRLNSIRAEARINLRAAIREVIQHVSGKRAIRSRKHAKGAKSDD